MSTYLFKQAKDLEEKNIEFAIVTIINTKGSTPRTNAKMIVTKDGIYCGTVGGGYGESKASLEAIEAIKEKKNRTINIKLGQEHSSTSLGEVDMFIDVIIPKKKILLVGAGHVNYCVYQRAIETGYEVIVIETREEYTKRFDKASTIVVKDSIEKCIKEITIDENTAIVISTHLLEQSDVEKLLKSKAFYIGMLGSRKKIKKQREEFLAKNINLDKYYSPLGLDLGSETPEQISISVIAEIMMVDNKKTGKSLSKVSDNLVIIRSAGDLASAIIARLVKSKFRVIALEVEKPLSIRRTVCFSQAIYDNSITIENVTSVKANDILEAKSLCDKNLVPVLIDPKGECIEKLKPRVVIDAVMAKKNICNTNIDLAPLVIALGPGFTAGKDCDCVIETSRGHYLGQIIEKGSAIKNTGIPGNIEGFTSQRVIHSPDTGIIKHKSKIGDEVKKGDVIAMVNNTPVIASITGVLRGLIQENLEVSKNLKIADIDPRPVKEHIYSFSDKARSISGSVLEVILSRS